MPNKTGYAVVTGGASGLGRAFCLRLAREGWHVAVADINAALAEQTLWEVESAGGSGQVVPLDVTSSEAWQALRAPLQSDWPRLDLLVNNAGVLVSGNVGDVELPDVERLVRINLLGAYYGCHFMVPWLKESLQFDRNGAFGPHIINVASIFAYYSPPGFAAYNLAKAGIVSLSESLYGELRPYGVGVTVVCPPVMATRLFESGTYRDDAYRQICQQGIESAQFTPEAVADESIAGARRGKLYVMVGRQARANWRWKRLVPAKFLQFVARHTRQGIEKARSSAPDP